MDLFIRVFRVTFMDRHAGFQYWIESEQADDNWSNYAESVDQLAISVRAKIGKIRSSGFNGTLRLHLDPPATFVEQFADGDNRRAGRMCTRLDHWEEERFFAVYFSQP
jgi:hypothetical protein